MAEIKRAEKKPVTRGIVPEIGLFLAVLILCVLLIFPLSPIVLSQVDNSSIESKVNVTNALPVIEAVNLYSEAAGPGSAITLTEGTSITVICNATIRDNNGWGDINITHESNATIWQDGISSFNAADDNNQHYTDTSCSLATINSSTASLVCTYSMVYYANDGTTWLCNVTTGDLDGAFAHRNSSATTVNPLFAINVSANNITHPTVLDFGNMAPDTTTADIDEQSLNITNTGNLNITFAIDGWGEYFNDNLSMNCTLGTIPSDNLRYDVNDNTPYTSMYTILNWSPPSYVPIPNGTIWQRTDDSDTDQSESTNTTWWKLHVPLGTKGFCNGTVIISAVEI